MKIDPDKMFFFPMLNFKYGGSGAELDILLTKLFHMYHYDGRDILEKLNGVILHEQSKRAAALLKNQVPFTPEEIEMQSKIDNEDNA